MIGEEAAGRRMSIAAVWRMDWVWWTVARRMSVAKRVVDAAMAVLGSVESCRVCQLCPS